MEKRMKKRFMLDLAYKIIKEAIDRYIQDKNLPTNTKQELRIFLEWCYFEYVENGE